MEIEKINIFGINFDNLDMSSALITINELIENNKVKGKKSFIVTPNVDHLVNISKSKEFKKVYENASLKLVDGMPIVILSKLFNKTFKEKISGADLTPRLIEHAYKNKMKVFIFGSNPGVPEIVIEKCMKELGEDFKIKSYSPPFGFEKDSNELNNSLKIINEFSPDLLFVSLGSPKGELFIYNNLDNLKVPVSIQVGAAIDFMAGTVKRAPLWMQKFCLEWFYRFLKEPKRMFKRYFVNDFYFVKLVIKELLK